MALTNVHPDSGPHYCPLCNGAMEYHEMDFFYTDEGKWVTYTCLVCETKWTAQDLLEVYNTTEDHTPDPWE